MTFDIPWEVIPYTDECVLRHRDTGQILEFTNDIYAPEQELPLLGLADMFSEEDAERLFKTYSKYELASGGW